MSQTRVVSGNSARSSGYSSIVFEEFFVGYAKTINKFTMLIPKKDMVVVCSEHPTFSGLTTLSKMLEKAGVVIFTAFIGLNDKIIIKKTTKSYEIMNPYGKKDLVLILKFIDPTNEKNNRFSLIIGVPQFKLSVSGFDTTFKLTFESQHESSEGFNTKFTVERIVTFLENQKLAFSKAKQVEQEALKASEKKHKSKVVNGLPFRLPHIEIRVENVDENDDVGTSKSMEKSVQQNDQLVALKEKKKQFELSKLRHHDLDPKAYFYRILYIRSNENGHIDRLQTLENALQALSDAAFIDFVDIPTFPLNEMNSIKDFFTKTNISSLKKFALENKIALHFFGAFESIYDENSTVVREPCRSFNSFNDLENVEKSFGFLMEFGKSGIFKINLMISDTQYTDGIFCDRDLAKWYGIGNSKKF